MWIYVPSVETRGMEMKTDMAKPTLKNKIKLHWHCFTHCHQSERHYSYEFLKHTSFGKETIDPNYIDCIRCHTCSMKIDRCLRKMEGRTYGRYGHWDSTYE